MKRPATPADLAPQALDPLARITDNVLPRYLEWRRAGLRAALVTLVDVKGGGYRPLGAQMAVAETGAYCGYISEGCLEAAIVAEAVDAIARGQNRRLQYGEDSDILDIRLPCGATIELFVDVGFPIARAEEITAALSRRQAMTLHLDLAGGAHRVAPAPPHAMARRQGDAFIRPYHPPVKLVGVGAAAALVSLAHFAHLSGYSVEVASNDQETLAATAAICGRQFKLATPQALPEFAIDARTALATLFHDHDWEVDILRQALLSDAFYIGSMGSRRSHEERLERLSACGLEAQMLARIHGPAGLFPSGRNAPEIALSILGEIALAAREAFGDADDCA